MKHFAISFTVSDSPAVPLAVSVVSSYQSVLPGTFAGSPLLSYMSIYCYCLMQIAMTLIENYSSGNSLGCINCVELELALKSVKLINISLKKICDSKCAGLVRD